MISVSRRSWRHAAPSLSGALLALSLVACGGGGGGGGDPTPPVDDGRIPDAPTAVLQPTQASAEALVDDANARTRDLRLAAGLTSVSPQAAGRAAPLSIAALFRPRAQATSDYSGTLCSSGSASIEIADAVLARFEADPNAELAVGDRIAVSASDCVVKAAVDLGDVALGSFGVGDTIDGGFVLTLQERSGSDVVFELVYTGFSYTPYGGSAYAPLDATLVFGTRGGAEVYTLDLPGTRFLAAPVVSETAGTVTIASGSLRGKVPAAAAAGYADYAYRGWVVDAARLVANSGSVTVTGAGGSSATIAATAGGFEVTVSVGGGTSNTFHVTR